jgi:hypothetical protein
MPRPVSLLAAAALVLLLPSAGLAGPPLPGDSYVDPCLHVCPAGDLVFRVIGGRAGHPECGWPAQIDLCGCPEVRLAPTLGTEPNTIYPDDPCLPSMMLPCPDAIADFPLAAGGVCRDAAIAVSAGLTLATLTAVSSPEQNGDLVVDAADIALAQAKLGTTDPTMDLDCDGVVTADDLAIQSAHLGHRWEGATPSPTASWGRVKTIYR